MSGQGERTIAHAVEVLDMGNTDGGLSPFSSPPPSSKPGQQGLLLVSVNPDTGTQLLWLDV